MRAPAEDPPPTRRPSDAVVAASSFPRGVIDGVGPASDESDDKVRPIVPGTEWLVRRLSGLLRRLWSHGFRFLFVLDAIGLFGSMVVISFVRFGCEWPTYSRSFYLGGFLAATAIHLVINYFYGLYEREPRLGHRTWLPRALVAMGIGVGIQAHRVRLPRPLPDAPRLNLVVFLFLGALVLAANRRLSRFLALATPGLAAGGARRAATAEVERAASHIGDDRGRGRARRPRRRPGRPAVRRSRGGRRTDVLLLDSVALDDAFPEPMTSLEARRHQLPQVGRCPRRAARPPSGAGDRRHAVRPAAGAQHPVVQGAPQADVRPHADRRDDCRSRCRCCSPSRPYVLVRAGRPGAVPPDPRRARAGSCSRW